MKPPITQPLAFENLLWVKKDGSETPVTIRIGVPYQVGEFEWACPAELRGVDVQFPDIRGDSSLQSLCLAIGLTRKRLTHLIEEGESLKFLADRSPWDLASLNATFGYP